VPRRRFPSLWLVPLLLAAACSGGGGGGGDGEQGEGGDSLKGQQVEVAATWSGTDQERFSAVLARFEERTGAEVKFTSTGSDMAGFLASRFDGGEAPDVALLPQARLLGELAGRGALKPLPRAAADLVDRNYDPVWRELATANGVLFGVFFKAVNKSTLWFNPTVLDASDVKPPATWEEFQAAAAALAGDGVPPVSVGGADGWTLTDWFENVYLRTAGTTAYTDLTRHQLAWDDPTVIEALRTLADVFQPQWLAGGPQGARQTDFATSVANVLADPPKAGFVLEANPPVAGENTGLVDFPSIGGSPPSVVVGGDAAVLLSDTPGGRALVEFLATPEAAEVWAALGGFTSPNKNVDSTAYRTQAERRASQALVGAEVVRFDMSDLLPAAFGADPARGLWPLLQEYLAKPAAAADVARSMELTASAIFEP
jgi:alpha-glucoside transport system substrate-binding protein